MKVQIHTTFVHDCSEFPDGFPRPGRFVTGETHDVPDDIGDYFIRAGWASRPGEKASRPDPTKPVFVRPTPAKHATANSVTAIKFPTDPA